MTWSLSALLTITALVFNLSIETSSTFDVGVSFGNLQAISGKSLAPNVVAASIERGDSKISVLQFLKII